MIVNSIYPGSYHVAEGKNALLAGCPPEIVKLLAQKNLAAPTEILLPDVPVSFGESQVAVEFPLYHHLFFGNSGEAPQPLRLLGNPRRVKAAMELLSLSLFGPDEHQMRHWGMEREEAEAMCRELRWLQPKDKNGTPMEIGAVVEPIVVGGKPVDLGWGRIQRVRTNVFRIEGQDGQAHELDLNLQEEQAPPYPVPNDLVTSKLVKFGIVVLGGATGFSSTQASSGLALCFNGHYMLIDSIPYLTHHLRARGIARNQVQSLFLSHIHDDHCNLVSLLQYNRRIQVLTTPVIFHMMLRKLSLMLDRPEQSLRDYFDFVPLTPGKETNFFGLRITPFYSSHSIPTIGAHFETIHDGANHRILFTGDMQSLARIRQMRKSGVIGQERCDELVNVYRKPARLLVADGGEGMLHGDPADALASPAERTVFLHMDKLPDRFETHFTTAAAGKRFCVLPGYTDFYLTRTIEFLLEYFPDMPPKWISHLLANQYILEYNAGDIIIREGAKSEGRVYMILCGYASVIHHEAGQRMNLACMEAGEIIGEMSIISGQGVRNASVVAQTPVTLTAFSEAAFREYVQEQNLGPTLKRMWQVRELLQTLPYLRTLQQPVLRSLGLMLDLQHLPARPGPVKLEKISPLQSLLMPLNQEIELRCDERQVVIPPNAAPIFVFPEDELITQAEFQLLWLKPEMAADMRSQIPAFRFFWEEQLGLPISVPKTKPAVPRPTKD